MTDIPLVMERFNPWWKGEGPKLPAPDISRDLLPTLMAGILKKPVQLVTGLRQVGKTTLQKQMILKLLKTIPPECILYYSFDLHGGEDSRGVVQELLETYLSSKLRTPLTELEEPVYIFLDEVHRLPGWSQEVKYYADLQPALRFVVTGSSSMNLSRGAGESLVGRASVHELSPFSFREFLAFQGFELPERWVVS
jgi:uncharacterized protein